MSVRAQARTIYVETVAAPRLLMSYAPYRRRMAGRLVGPAAGVDRHDGPPRLEFALIVLGFMLREPAPTRAPTSPAMPAPAAALERTTPRVPAAMAGPTTGITPARTPSPARAPRPRPVRAPVKAPEPACESCSVSAASADAFGVSHGDADLGLGEPGLVKLGDGLIGVEAVLEHADDGGTLLSIHGCIKQQILFRSASKLKFVEILIIAKLAQYGALPLELIVRLNPWPVCCMGKLRPG